MSRRINLSDSKGRNAEVVFKSVQKQPLVKTVTAEGKPTQTARVLKATVENSYESLLKLHGNDDAIAQALISADPELNINLAGMLVNETSKVYINTDLKPVFKIHKTEAVHLPDGSLKEERTPKETIANILADFPIKPVGKYLPKNEVYSKLVFSKKYQISHVNGLTFDFLLEIAKDLHDQQALMMLAGGEKSNEPLVFQDGGKTYRAFLEGRIKDNGYVLLMHLSNLELKGLG